MTSVVKLSFRFNKDELDTTLTRKSVCVSFLAGKTASQVEQDEQSSSTAQVARSTAQLSSRAGCPLDERQAIVMCAGIGRNEIGGRGVKRPTRR
jgi:butyrate kinase